MSEHEAQSPKSSGPSLLLVLLALGAIFAVVVVAALAFINRDVRDSATQTVDTGSAIVGDNLFSTGLNHVEPKLIGDFTLTRADGSSIRLVDLRGKYTLLYFGYTYCPDFCPSTMTDWRLTIRALGEQADRVNFLMISIDPDRDTPEVLTQYLAPFDSAIIGATGEKSLLRTMADQFGAFFEPIAQDSTPLYMVNHTASQFVLDPEGNFVTVYAFGTPVDIITDDLREKLNARR